MADNKGPIAPRNQEEDNALREKREAERRELSAAISPYPRLDVPEGEKPELMEFLKELPEVTNLPKPTNEVVTEEITPEKTEEQLKMEAIANKIRGNTRMSQITPLASLVVEEENASEILAKMAEDEAFSDIVNEKGQKDTYYYSNNRMTPQYANIAILVEEENHVYTVAKMTRYHCKLHPAPTPERYFLSHPYYYSKELMDQVREVLKNDSEYADIKEVNASNGKLYFYSTEHMTERYARGLSNEAEYQE